MFTPGKQCEFFRPEQAAWLASASSKFRPLEVSRSMNEILIANETHPVLDI